jgi:CheY-like chemotaxis protein
MQILVVDDAPDCANYLTRLVQIWGHTCQTAYGGREAIKLAFDLSPEVVLLDLSMPEVDGYEVARRLRESPVLKDTLIIGLTANALDWQRRPMTGFTVVLRKPPDTEAIKLLLERYDCGRQRDETARTGIAAVQNAEWGTRNAK